MNADCGKYKIGDNTILFFSWEQLHTFEDWVYSADYCRLGSDVVVSVGAYLNPGNRVEDGCTITPGSVLIKGEHVWDPKKEDKEGTNMSKFLPTKTDKKDGKVEPRRFKVAGFPVRVVE